MFNDKGTNKEASAQGVRQMVQLVRVGLVQRSPLEMPHPKPFKCTTGVVVLLHGPLKDKADDIL